MVAHYNPSTQDSTFTIFNWKGEKICLLDAKQRIPLQGCATYFDEKEHWTKSASPTKWGAGESTIEQKEFYEVLRKCKNKLKDIQNTVFSLKYLEGMESEEICKELNISASNYWVLIHRAKLQLRACLEKNWFLN